MKKIQWKPLIISLGSCFAVGGVAALLTMKSMENYEQMYQPPLSPPSWAFGVAWSILYFLMGIAAYLVYVEKSEDSGLALKYFAAQLIVNGIWPIIYFNFAAYLLALAWLALLLYLVWVTLTMFWKIKKLAGGLLIPYFLWLLFAFYLNFAVALHYL